MEAAMSMSKSPEQLYYNVLMILFRSNIAEAVTVRVASEPPALGLRVKKSER